MKKANAFAAVVLLSVTTLAFTAKPVFNLSHDDNPMLKIVDETFRNAISISPTHDRNHDFVHYIQALHNGAVNLAQYELENGHHEEVKALAQIVIDSMKTEIAMMERFRAKGQPAGDTKEKFASEIHDALNEMVKKADNTQLKGDVDHDYTVLMRRIVEAERDIAKAYIKYGANKDLERLAKRLVDVKMEEKKDLKEGKQEVKREDKK